jgi:hypothetical protein
MDCGIAVRTGRLGHLGDFPIARFAPADRSLRHLTVPKIAAFVQRNLSADFSGGFSGRVDRPALPETRVLLPSIPVNPVSSHEATWIAIILKSA